MNRMRLEEESSSSDEGYYNKKRGFNGNLEDGDEDDLEYKYEGYEDDLREERRLFSGLGGGHKRRKQTKEQSMLGIFASDDEDDNDGYAQRSRSKGSRRQVTFLKKKDGEEQEQEEEEEGEEVVSMQNLGLGNPRSKQKGYQSDNKGKKVGNFATKQKQEIDENVVEEEASEDFGAFAIKGKGTVWKMMLKMGYRPGEGLGKEGEGIVNPVETKLRPGKNMGIAYKGFSEKTRQAQIREIKENKQRNKTVKKKKKVVIRPHLVNEDSIAQLMQSLEDDRDRRDEQDEQMREDGMDITEEMDNAEDEVREEKVELGVELSKAWIKAMMKQLSKQEEAKEIKVRKIVELEEKIEKETQKKEIIEKYKEIISGYKAYKDSMMITTSLDEDNGERGVDSKMDEYVYREILKKTRQAMEQEDIEAGEKLTFNQIGMDKWLFSVVNKEVKNYSDVKVTEKTTIKIYKTMREMSKEEMKSRKGYIKLMENKWLEPMQKKMVVVFREERDSENIGKRGASGMGKIDSEEAIRELERWEKDENVPEILKYRLIKETVIREIITRMLGDGKESDGREGEVKKQKEKESDEWVFCWLPILMRHEDVMYELYNVVVDKIDTLTRSIVLKMQSQDKEAGIQEMDKLKNYIKKWNSVIKYNQEMMLRLEKVMVRMYRELIEKIVEINARQQDRASLIILVRLKESYGLIVDSSSSGSDRYWMELVGMGVEKWLKYMYEWLSRLIEQNLDNKEGYKSGITEIYKWYESWKDIFIGGEGTGFNGNSNNIMRWQGTDENNIE
ncbi:Tuftelin-interacting protein 11 [Zancudomyces culisetae]|uniref:Tuftelin-interacting protein 11 n=1 Tax=Zancudomyces culisetae TaxID=1213189 RepID=A0A1R1PZM5_ZANCU|nr:Tuftelin-interacting protein 11 [Zancudomyces culisetae]|eukprot:OMH86394.1 Tuftelin-interacting protein 11 [Zancudomyces culisetae]